MSPDRKMNVNRIAALPRGEVVISNEVGPRNNIRHVWRFNKDGKLDRIMYKCDKCVKVGALLLLGYDIFVIHTNGTVIQIDLQTAQIVKVYTIENVVSVIHTGCLYSDPTHIDKDLLLLADEGKGVIFSYRLSTNRKQVHVRRLIKPSSVSYYFHYNTIYFVVCDSGAKEIQVYNSRWKLLWSFKSFYFLYVGFPSAAVVSSEKTLLIAGAGLYNICEFNIKGEFIKCLQKFVIKKPKALSIQYPFLWVVSTRMFVPVPTRFKFIRNLTSTGDKDA